MLVKQKLLCFVCLIDAVLTQTRFPFLSSDPDANRDIFKLISSRGFIPEAHYVTTSDGYILALHRIVNPLIKTKTKPVILQHCLLCSGVEFIINSAGGAVGEPIVPGIVGNNLGFELSRRGYDVWLGNSRGNTYCRNHTTLNPDKDDKFWEFSFDQHIEHDLPATIEYVLNTTKSATVGYVGHSQGSLIMFGLLSTNARYNQIIKPFIALAPVTTVGYIQSPIQYVAKNSALRNFMSYRGGQFYPRTFFNTFLANMFCPTMKWLCSNSIFLFSGFNPEQTNMTRMPVYFANTPSGTSTQNIVHYFQGIDTKKFRRFDYGSFGNKKRYGTYQPPEYPLEKITSPNIALFHSQNDRMASPQDVASLKKRLTVALLLDYEIPDKKWSHLDFIWAKDAGKYVNSKVLSILEMY